MITAREFEAYDRGLATGLVTFGYPPEALDRIYRHSVGYSFTWTGGLEDLV